MNRKPASTEAPEGLLRLDEEQIPEDLEDFEDDEEMADEDDLPEPADCPVCGGPGVPLGALGRLEHYRCRDCGMDFNRDPNESVNEQRLDEFFFYAVKPTRSAMAFSVQELGGSPASSSPDLEIHPGEVFRVLKFGQPLSSIEFTDGRLALIPYEELLDLGREAGLPPYLYAESLDEIGFGGVSTVVDLAKNVPGVNPKGLAKVALPVVSPGVALMKKSKENSSLDPSLVPFLTEEELALFEARPKKWSNFKKAAFSTLQGAAKGMVGGAAVGALAGGAMGTVGGAAGGALMGRQMGQTGAGALGGAIGAGAVGTLGGGLAGIKYGTAIGAGYGLYKHFQRQRKAKPKESQINPGLIPFLTEEELALTEGPAWSRFKSRWKAAKPAMRQDLRRTGRRMKYGLGGAGVGALAGTVLGGPIGTGLGAVVGSAMGTSYAKGIEHGERSRRPRRKRSEAVDQIATDNTRDKARSYASTQLDLSGAELDLYVDGYEAGRSGLDYGPSDGALETTPYDMGFSDGQSDKVGFGPLSTLGEDVTTADVGNPGTLTGFGDDPASPVRVRTAEDGSFSIFVVENGEEIPLETGLKGEAAQQVIDDYRKMFAADTAS